jgi:hypothetical protein
MATKAPVRKRAAVKRVAKTAAMSSSRTVEREVPVKVVRETEAERANNTVDVAEQPVLVLEATAPDGTTSEVAVGLPEIPTPTENNR